MPMTYRMFSAVGFKLRTNTSSNESVRRNEPERIGLADLVGWQQWWCAWFDARYRNSLSFSPSIDCGVSSLDTFAQQTSESRPNTAPAATRSAATAAVTGGATSSARPAAASSSRARTEDAKPAASASAPASGASSAASGASKNAQIQMSALSNILANLSGTTPGQAAEGASAAQESSIDLCDIINSEVSELTHSAELADFCLCP